eukprot:TRINITY_DN2909_c0_g1_i2.p1 TRINITY_DN2909_c0_g1~~TRINITY_DN2909_c0_g1_i2.p1  ORF type:complete len:419 (+),score=103.82 TRINITY_DN2909_c0_g1_i2:134-1390(+)
MIRRPPRSTLSSSSAASDVYKRQMWKWALAWFGGSAVFMAAFLKHMATQMHPRRYQRTTLVLQLEADYKKAPHVLKKDQAAHDAAAKEITEKLGKFNKGELKVVRREVDDLDPDAIYCREAPVEFPEFRTVIEMFYAPGSTRTIARMTTHLKCYDGVVATGAVFNTWEILEGKEPSPPLVGNAKNPPFSYGLWTFWNYLKVVGRLQKSAILSLPSFFTDKTLFPPNALALFRQESPREWFQYCEPLLSFKECAALAEEIMERCELYGVVYTSNYAHERATGTCSVALGIMPGMKNISNKTEKLNNLFTPTAFVDVDNVFASITSNGLFWNNYGIHNNELEVTVDGFRWFMLGTPDGMCPIITLCTIHGRVHALVTLPRQMHAKCEDLLAKLGPNKRRIQGPTDVDAFFKNSAPLVPGL